MKRKDDKIIHIRKYAKAEVPHQAIYEHWVYLTNRGK
jgi:hypothetical protein